LTAQLKHRFVHQSITVQPARRQLPASGVEGQFAAEADARPTFDERAALSGFAEPQRLQPDQGQHAEPVIELDGVDIGGPQLGAAPQVLGCARRGHLGERGLLIPRVAAAERGPDGVDIYRAGAQVGGAVRGRDDDRGRPVHGNIAVEQAQRPGDHPRGEVFIQGKRIAVDGKGIQRGMAAAGQWDLPELRAGGAELVEVAGGQHGQPVRRRRSPEHAWPPHHVRRGLPVRVVDRRAPAAFLRRRLGHCAVDQHVATQARRDGHHGRHDRRQLAGQFGRPLVPIRLQP
jgi:hypothetical protein